MGKPFRVGIWIDENDLPETGGGFSYTQRLVNAIDNREFDQSLEIYFIGFNLEANFKKKTINLPYKKNYLSSKIVNFLHKFFRINIERNNFSKIQDKSKALLEENHIELIFYPDPHVRIENFPYIMVNWDLGHKSSLAFPEFSMNNQYKFRSRNAIKNLNEAIFVCCESEQGKAEIEKYLQINPDRLKILPIFSGKIIEDSIIEEMPAWFNQNQFYFYPAQFWPHKNHYNLILGFNEMLKKSEYKNFDLILTGSDKGNLDYIKSIIESLKLSDRIRITGFIKNEELKWLYKNAVGLVYPSFLGPTNMPLLEANALGCNIACSNLSGHQELLGKSAVYFDPKSPQSICEAMIETYNSRATIKDKIDLNLNDNISILNQIFIDSIPIRRTWGFFDKIR